jgi:methyl-accepting chemotaxis protein
VEERLQKNFLDFEAMFGREFKIDGEGNLVVDDAYGVKLNNNFTQVDEFAAKYGGVATVFQFRDGDFYRIATSLKREDGTRAVGTNLGTSNPAFASLIKGQGFAGRANLFGFLYATQYQAIKDKNGKVVGAFFIGFEATRRAAIESLTQFDQGHRNLGELIKLVENGDPAFGMTQLKSDVAKDLISNISKQYQQLEPVSAYIETTARPLLEARASLLNMVVSAESALISADKFSEEMAAGASASLAKLVFSAALVAVALLALAVVGLVNNRITRREAWDSAYKNKANEKDIIEFMKDIGPLEFGNLAVGFTDNVTAMEGITGGIRSSVNEAVISLRDAMSTVKSTTGSVMANVTDSVESSRDLKVSNDRQVKEIDDVVGRVADLTTAIDQVTGNTLLAANMTQSAKAASDAGALVVSQTNAKMTEIRTSMQDVLKSVKHLGETSHEIGSIVEAIETITDRTQVIAVNASLEAAKAGAAGQGFQVLAGEVNRLAEQSNEALRTITALVQRIQGETASTIRVVEDSTNSVVDGARLSESANVELTKISQLSENLQGIMKQIREQSEQQSGNAGSVRESMDRLSELSKEFQSSVGRMVTGVQQIDASMGTLQSTVSVFNTEEQNA